MSTALNLSELVAPVIELRRNQDLQTMTEQHHNCFKQDSKSANQVFNQIVDSDFPKFRKTHEKPAAKVSQRITPRATPRAKKRHSLANIEITRTNDIRRQSSLSQSQHSSSKSKHRKSVNFGLTGMDQLID